MIQKPMDRYSEELECRFNNRDNPHIFHDTLERIMNTENLTSRRLAALGARLARTSLTAFLFINSVNIPIDPS